MSSIIDFLIVPTLQRGNAARDAGAVAYRVAGEPQSVIGVQMAPANRKYPHRIRAGKCRQLLDHCAGQEVRFVRLQNR
ncbi:MAG: hypothetical protein WC091_24175 [Sulfuricellaceae bacterium]